MTNPLDRLWIEADALDRMEATEAARGAAYLSGWLGALCFAKRYPELVGDLEQRLHAISFLGNSPDQIRDLVSANEALADDLAAGMAGAGDALN